jgi:hypothetical protein
MEAKRIGEIKDEAERRVKLWMMNSSFDKMTTGGSKMLFEMAIGARGNPHQMKTWMTSNDTKSFVTPEEFTSSTYNQIIKELYEKYYDLKD